MRALLVCLPVALGGMLAAHEVAYRGTETSSHGYMGGAETIVCALLAVGLVAAVRGPAGKAPTWIFAICPPLAFLLQESAERGFEPGFLLEPAVLAGLALQLPFALLAWGLARLLLRAAESLGRLLRRGVRPRGAARLPHPARLWEPRAAFVLAGAGRGPPALSLS
jgi:hypothetical protein